MQNNIIDNVISDCYGIYVELSVGKSRVRNATPKYNHGNRVTA
jgi:hypothetical protein